LLGHDVPDEVITSVPRLSDVTYADNQQLKSAP
jgi:hypothetical protein